MFKLQLSLLIKYRFTLWKWSNVSVDSNLKSSIVDLYCNYKLFSMPKTPLKGH